LIEVDGSIGEGGGQVVRTGIALSTLLKKSIHIYNIRVKRSPPGFRAQHLTGVKAVATLSNARVEGLEIGSRELTFEPRSSTPSGTFVFDVGTAGSISLVLQALMPAAAFAQGPIYFDLTGGTDVRWSPLIDYVRFVVLPTLTKMNYKVELTVRQRGHYPKGGGRVTMSVQPCYRLNLISLLEFGEILWICGLSHCVKLPQHVAVRQANAATSGLNKAGYNDVKIDTEWYPQGRDPHLGPGSGIVVYAKTSSDAILGGDALGERGKPAEKVGEEAAQKLLAAIGSGAPVDKHLGDILIPYMAVAEGRSEIVVSEVTLHLLTNVQVTEIIAGVNFKIQGELGKTGTISVDGLGLVNPSVVR